MTPVNLAEKSARIPEPWSPRIVAELNGQPVKLVQRPGELVRHRHEHEDELFHAARGSFRMEFRERTINVRAGELIVVPRGVEHRPVAPEEAGVLLFEPAATVNTGDNPGVRTVAASAWL